MHELSIVMSIIDIAEDTARKENASVITEIELDIGKQSGVVMEALEFAIEAAKTGTLLENAEWKINQIPARARCSSCGHEFEVEHLYEPCARCSNPFSDVYEGRELKVKSLKIK